MSNLDRGLANLRTSRSLSYHVGYFMKKTSFLVTIRFNETVHLKWRLDKRVDQTKNGLGRGFVNH